jgi:hypothetical protein
LMRALEAQQQPGSKPGLAAALLGGAPAPRRGGLGLLNSAMNIPMASSTLLGGLAAGAPAWSPTWPFVTKRFTTFIDNLALTDAQVADGVTKFKGVVKTLNQAYWNSDSETDHAFYIGSWAKQTRIRPPRDVDLYFVLPNEVYWRFEKYSGNKQSALLQEVKAKLLASYPLSDIKGDGPVVLAGFWTFNVEIVPAFALAEERTYMVPITRDGGKYKTTKPLHEVDAIEWADQRNNNNVRRLVRMLKCWQAYCTVPLKSFYLELLATDFLDQWAYKDKSYFYYDWMCRDFFAWLITKANSFVMAPGTYEIMWIGDAWKSKAESAHGRAVKACDHEYYSREGDAGDEWQKIFGTDIPKCDGSARRRNRQGSEAAGRILPLHLDCLVQLAARGARVSGAVHRGPDHLRLDRERSHLRARPVVRLVDRDLRVGRGIVPRNLQGPRS